MSSRKLCAAASELLRRGGDNLFDDWSIADVDLTLMLNRLIMNGDQVPLDLVRYARAQWERPSVQRWVCRDASSAVNAIRIEDPANAREFAVSVRRVTLIG